MEMITQVYSIISQGVGAVYGWLTQIMNSVFGTYLVFGFIIVLTMTLTYALKIVGLSGGSFTDVAKKERFMKEHERRVLASRNTVVSTYIDPNTHKIIQ